MRHPQREPAARRHHVTVLAFDGAAGFEVAVATEVFGQPIPQLGDDWYALDVAAPGGGPLRAVPGYAILAGAGLEAARRADTLVVTGSPAVAAGAEPPAAVLDAVHDAAARGARLVAMCTGAFVLARAGLLDGLPATTHWRFAAELAARFPRVDVQQDVLYVDAGPVLTSAGGAAGLDLCLHVVRQDFGAATANAVARGLVLGPHRHGGFAQRAEAPVARPGDDRVAETMQWALAHLDRPLTVSELAGHACMSPRTFLRRFRAAAGTSPSEWLLEQRVQASLPLLERSDLPVETVGLRVGFPTPASFRKHFRRTVGRSPLQHRRSVARAATF